ncbi:MAG: pentapeptide repeat-containing protein [Henriciella sp.]
MLKHFAILITAAGLMTAPAIAQNATQIAQAKAGQSCADCNLFQADLSFEESKNVDLSGARLRQSNMALSTFEGVNFSGANLSVANLFGARLNRTDLSGANLENAVAVGTYFGSSNFAGANLNGTNFSGANLTIAKGLTQTQLNRACGDHSTRLPTGKTIPSCS